MTGRADGAYCVNISRIIKLERDLEHASRMLQEKNKSLEESESALRWIAHFDKLTSRPNRVLFFDRLGRVLAESIRNRKKQLAPMGGIIRTL